MARLRQLLVATGSSEESLAPDLAPRIYDELRRLAAWYLRGERPNHTLQPTALVHETYLRLIDQTRADWKDRAHFFAIAAREMRHILVDSARRRKAGKRGAGVVAISLDDAEQTVPEPVDLVLLDHALLSLDLHDPRARQVVELRFFGGLSVEETAEALGISAATVKRDWEFARLWLLAEMNGSGSR